MSDSTVMTDLGDYPRSKAGFQARLRCCTCGTIFSVFQTFTHCPHCKTKEDKRRGLLSVEHDLEALAWLSPEIWRQLFDLRLGRNQTPYGSGVWRFKEFVAPFVDDTNVVSLFEGNSNLFSAQRLRRELGLSDLWIKLCGNSHSGSFKDLGMTIAVSTVMQMRAQGQRVPAIACASTGDTSAALSAFGAEADIPVIVLLPRDKVSIPQLLQPLCNGAITLSLDSDFDTCMEIVDQLCQESGIYLANSMNPLRLEGQKTIAMEMVQQFDWQPIDTVIVPVGNCGNITALCHGFLMMQTLGIIEKLPRIIGAQAAHANPLAELYERGYPDDPFVPQRARDTQASAIQIGDPINLFKAINALKRMPSHQIVSVSEEALANAAARADRAGLFTCPQTGVALGALLQLVERKEIGADERVVVISTASGLKFTDFKIAYHKGVTGGADARYRNVPIEVEASLSAVQKALEPTLKSF